MKMGQNNSNEQESGQRSEQW